MGKRHNLSAESWTAGGGGVVELCLIPKKETLNFQSRWLNVRRRTADPLFVSSF